MVIINFIRDPEVGIFARAKRKGKGVPVVAAGTASPVAEGSEAEIEKEKVEASLLVE